MLYLEPRNTSSAPRGHGGNARVERFAPAFHKNTIWGALLHHGGLTDNAPFSAERLELPEGGVFGTRDAVLPHSRLWTGGTRSTKATRDARVPACLRPGTPARTAGSGTRHAHVR